MLTLLLSMWQWFSLVPRPPQAIKAGDKAGDEASNSLCCGFQPPYSRDQIQFVPPQEYEDLDEILARFIQPMASFARDLLSHKCYRAASGGDKKTLESILAKEKDKNPKRIPYFFSASRQYPGKFMLAYQPASKPRIEYITITPDGFRYRNHMHNSVETLVKWFKDHYRDPIPRPIPTTTSHVPSHLMTASQNIDPSLFPHLQAAVNTAHQQRGGGSSSSPYTPSQWATSTPTPQYGQQPYQYGGYAYQQGQYGGAHFQSGAYRGWNPHPNWTPSHSIPRTPTQTPGRTPAAYTPTQTPRSFVGSVQSTPQHHPNFRGPPLYQRRPNSPLGTPLLDE